MKDVVDKAFDDLESAIGNPKRVLHVAIVIDSSGSMIGLKQFVVQTFNEQLEALKKEADENLEVKVSVMTFSYAERIEFLRWETDIRDIKLLTEDEYKPDGGTALYDAMGMMLDRLSKADDYSARNDSSFLFMAITDGEENSSKRYDQTKIKSLLDELQATNRWTVTYYGTSPEEAAKRFNLNAGNVKMFDYNQIASGAYAADNANATRAYMVNIKAGGQSVSDYYNVPGNTAGEVDPAQTTNIGVVGQNQTIAEKKAFFDSIMPKKKKK